MCQDSLVLEEFIKEYSELLLPLFQEFRITPSDQFPAGKRRQRACILFEELLHDVLLERPQHGISISDQKCHLLVWHGGNLDKVLVMLPVGIFPLGVIKKLDPEGMVSGDLFLC